MNYLEILPCYPNKKYNHLRTTEVSSCEGQVRVIIPRTKAMTNLRIYIVAFLTFSFFICAVIFISFGMYKKTPITCLSGETVIGKAALDFSLFSPPENISSFLIILGNRLYLIFGILIVLHVLKNHLY